VSFRHRPLSLALLPWLLGTFAALSPLAYASPPDPTWQTGIFDDDDADNVVEFIASVTALVEPFVYHSPPPRPICVALHAPVRESLPLCPASSSPPVRAPPSS
jgi:hypothetical protein